MRFNLDCNCKTGHGDLHFINLRNCAGYGYNTHNKTTNACPPEKPWWDDGKYPDLDDFGGFFNPWFFPGYGPNVPMPIGKDDIIVESTSGKSIPGFHYVPYWPYIAPDKPVADEKDKCCCKDEWECGDEWYYGRCNKK
ncbi:hypothetical protein AN639_00235 [Candidatus Epulonipiscium fishelsonii]|uniref:Uncharacterized protein n=1 Tax=Candidatus Epulonipiscium fishelsonii TaxID=77094 RepID=A0ACC8XEF8_9FIRM|nr:hypothetical protein AN396_00575 [Epulopiscium sp. SCG-B11WGA-EpuloA1]ONI43952.1 hypothetical protein AN639_00235 [Epulopiscium sp. SCG-B05WGA-EpuloA1]